MIKIVNLFTLKDIATDAGQLFNGEAILLHSDKITLTGNPKVIPGERNFNVVEITGTETLAENYNRRKANVSYMGFSNPIVILGGTMSEEAIGSNTMNVGGTNYKVLTPTRFMELVHAGRQLYLMDTVLIKYLSTVDEDSEYYYTSEGMPVVISSWSLEPEMGESKAIKWSLTLIEDKE